jgi:DNA recombination-dependent growth factor C
LENQTQSIEDDIYAMEETIKILIEQNTKTLPSGYNPHASLSKKIIYVLKQSNKVKTVKELYQKIGLKDKLAGLDVNPKTYFANVHSTLTSYCKKGIYFKRYKADDENYLYGLAEWFDEDGEILKLYLPE